MLVGFGRARGAPLGPLNAIAHMIYGTRAYFMMGFDWGVTLSALVLHVITLVALAIPFALIAGRLRGTRLLVTALLYAGFIFVVDQFVVPARVAPGIETQLSGPELGAVYVVLGLSLALGVRLWGGRDARVA